MKNIFLLLIVLTLSYTYVKCYQKLYTNEFAVCLKTHKCDEKSAHSLAQKYGFILVGQIGALDCHYLLRLERISKQSTDYSHSHHSLLSRDSDVTWVEQQHIRQHVKRDNPNTEYRFDYKPMPDPYYERMWYLNKDTVGGHDMNVEGAWAMGYTGKGSVVSVVDDGVEGKHPDLVQNFDPRASYDFNDNDPDPTPQDDGDNTHGTRCAGEIAAQAYNEFCGVGVAFNASLGGIRILDGPVTDAMEAQAFTMNRQHIDIYTASWGPTDNGKALDGPSPLLARAIFDGIQKGRNGKGSIFIWASGDGGRNNDNCNCDGYQDSIYTISISSATQSGLMPSYLEKCSSTLTTTYCDGTRHKGVSVLTINQDTKYFKSLESGGPPDTSNLCVTHHGGTSAAAPFAAGIVALALEANPNLTWRDVQHIIVLSSRYAPLRHESGWFTNGVGRRVSHTFGYGLIDAEAMVRFAENWTPVSTQIVCESTVYDEGWDVSEQPNDPLELEHITDGCGINYLEHTVAKITLDYKPRGMLRISLISPLGTISHLLTPRPKDDEESTFTNWPFLSVHFWGEPVVGKWKLIIENDNNTVASAPGKLISWSLLFYGTYVRPASLHTNYNQTIDVIPRNVPKISGCLKDGLFRALGYTECLNICPTGQWADSQLGICQKCSPECMECFGPTNHNCLSCNQNKLFFGYQCLKQCPDHYYSDSKLNECLPCSSNCMKCDSSPDHCIACNSSLLLNGRNRCISECHSSKECSECHNSCQTCYGRAVNQCLSCASGLRLYNGVCTERECPQSYFEIGSECFRCHPSCHSCNGPTHEDCTDCLENATLSRGLCLNCSSGQFFNNQTTKCEACHHTCDSCIGQAFNQCLSCKNGLNLDNNRCIPCCSPNVNDIRGLSQNFDECCHCFPSTGTCALNVGIEVSSSIKIETFIFTKNYNFLDQLFASPRSIILSVCLSAVILFVIIFIFVAITNRCKRRDRYMNSYRKVTTNS